MERIHSSQIAVVVVEWLALICICYERIPLPSFASCEPNRKWQCCGSGIGGLAQPAPQSSASRSQAGDGDVTSGTKLPKLRRDFDIKLLSEFGWQNFDCLVDGSLKATRR